MELFSEQARAQWLHKLGNLMLLSRRKNTSLGNLEFNEKKRRYFEQNVETLPNSARVLLLSKIEPSVLEGRHKNLLAELESSY
jgi:hypothetical protein